MPDTEKDKLAIDAAAEHHADAANDAMTAAIEHYIKHHEVVLRKLTHAHEATITSIREIEDMMADLEKAKMESNDAQLKEVKKYDGLWEAIIASFRSAGVSEEELQKIEDILFGIPQAIRTHYEALLQQDKKLLMMIDELGQEKYKRAFEIIRKVQSQPNPMSGLGPEEYETHIDEDGATANTKASKAFIFAPAKKKRPAEKKRKC